MTIAMMPTTATTTLQTATMVSQLSENQSPTSSHQDRFWMPASDASSILFLASRAASSRILRASSAIFFAASSAPCAESTADCALVCAVLACWASRVAARTFASSGLSASDLLPVGSSLYLSASFDARVTHESAEDSFDCAEDRSARASRALISALSASACARSSFGQKSASASPHIPYDFSSFFKFFGTPENSSLKTAADFPAHSARVDSPAIPFTRRNASETSSAKSCNVFASVRTRCGSPGVGSLSKSRTCQSLGLWPTIPATPVDSRAAPATTRTHT
ncbi:hypothetical protein STENM223S_01983 [Streptomyces tendae]